MQEILFVDLDGTIRRSKSGEKFIQFPQDQEAILGAKEAITKYSTQGYQGYNKPGWCSSKTQIIR